MIAFEHIDVVGFEPAIRGMRNPYDSWDKSDSVFARNGDYVIGEKDLELMKKLYKAGPEHRKYLRFIIVYIDVVAPLYWWKEYDTYKVGTVCNSCSTMHTIAKEQFIIEPQNIGKEIFTPSSFSTEHLISSNHSEMDNYQYVTPRQALANLCWTLNESRQLYLDAKKAGDTARAKMFWWQMIQLLPSSYNQRRTLGFTYENVVSILRQRKGHKLDEWRKFREMLKMLPYIGEITGGEFSGEKE